MSGGNVTEFKNHNGPALLDVKTLPTPVCIKFDAHIREFAISIIAAEMFKFIAAISYVKHGWKFHNRTIAAQ